jgi:hypothetical protein
MAATKKSFKVTYDPSKGPVTLEVSSGYATSGSVLVYHSTKPDPVPKEIAKGEVDKGKVVIEIPGVKIPKDGISLAKSLINVVGRFAPGGNHSQITICVTMSQQGKLLSVDPDPNIADVVAGGISKDYEYRFEFVERSKP